MKLRARWTGPLPRVGDYLMSQVRPRHAYQIEMIDVPDHSVRWDQAAKAEVWRITFDVRRVEVTKVPKSARVHPWRWDRRDRARQVTAPPAGRRATRSSAEDRPARPRPPGARPP